MEENDPVVLAASDSTGRLGQDWLGDVLESRIVRVSEWHPILHRIASQTTICDFHMRFKAI